MTSYTFTVGSTPKSVVGNFTWNANGTLSKLAITDGFNSGGTGTCKYGDPSNSVAGYDDLDRLISTNCGTTWSQNFTYDPFGNITKTVPGGDAGQAWNPGYNQSNNQYTLTGTNYDASGDLLADTFHNYSWNAYGNPGTIDTTTLTYDAIGRMVERTVSGTTTEIEFSPLGKTCQMNGSTQVQCYVPLPGGALLSPSPDTIWHTDWLGSVRLASSNGQRTVTFDRGFAPFGETSTNFGSSSNPDFTGNTQDTVAGTYDTWFREYHPTQGRWISPDPAGLRVAYPSNPQTWNRYAYVGNNPLSLTDTLGLFIQCPSPGLGQVMILPGGVNSDGTTNCPTYGYPGGCTYVSGNGSGSMTCFGIGNCPAGWACIQPAGCPSGVSQCQGGGQGGVTNGPPAQPNPPKLVRHPNCDSVLPNGQNLGDTIQQFRGGMALVSAPQSAGSESSGTIPLLYEIAKPGGPIDFKNIYSGQADPTFLGQAGNFAYYAIGSGFLPNWELDLAAMPYAIWAHGALTSPSAQAVRSSALAANGCS